MKQALRDIYAQVLERVDPTKAMEVPAEVLQQGHEEPRLVVIAFGKAARPMAAALVDRMKAGSMRGLVVPPETDAAPLPPFEVIGGGHPLPTTGSIAAGKRALELARSVTGDETLVFLISGGGSAMLEAPADPGVTVAELRTLNQALVGSGAGIAEINTVRRHLSAIKGGRLALAGVAARLHRNLVISDVPADTAASAIASGPTIWDRTTIADCRAVLDRYELWQAVPPTLRARLQADDLPPPMPPDHELGGRMEFWIIAGEGDARDAAASGARDHGWIVDDTCDVDDWPYEKAAEHLLERLAELHRQNPGKPVAIVTTGELSVTLPASPGIGGRNSQFALACAKRIAGQPITVLSCGTDGIDGNAPSAGGIVDGTTIARAEQLGLDVDDHLTRCDAHTLLAALGDDVTPGPTGTNVRDVRVLVRQA